MGENGCEFLTKEMMLGQGPLESVDIQQTDGPQGAFRDSLGSGESKCKSMTT